MATAVVIAGDDKRRSLLRAGIGAAVDEVIEVGEPEELRGGGAASLAVIAGADPAALLRRAAGRLGEDTPIVVVVDDVQPRAAVEALELEPRLVAVLAAERATPAALAALLAHVRRAGFGLTGWVPAGTEVHAAEIATYADKVACIDRLQREAEAALVRGKYRDAIAECADELMMNALYAAPRAAVASGAPAGGQSIAERVGRTVRVEWARAGDWFHVAVRDRWGALRRDALLDSWGAAIDAGARADDSGAGGLGLSIVAAASTGIHFTTAPGVATECVCSFDTRQTRLHLQEVGLVREADAARLADLRRTLAPPPPTRTAAAPAMTPAMRALVIALIVVLIVLAVVFATR